MPKDMLHFSPFPPGWRRREVRAHAGSAMRPGLPPSPCPTPSVVSSPPQRLLPDLRRFELSDDGWYAWCRSVGPYEGLCLVVPRGFDHDFASVPRLVWSFISPIDLGVASIFHDWLYRHGGRVETLAWRRGGAGWTSADTPWTRRDADRLFARIMREQGVPRWRRRMAYRSVRLLGGGAWVAS